MTLLYTNKAVYSVTQVADDDYQVIAYGHTFNATSMDSLRVLMTGVERAIVAKQQRVLDYSNTGD